MIIAKHTKVDVIWFAGRSPTSVAHSLRGAAMNLKATTLTYLAIPVPQSVVFSFETTVVIVISKKFATFAFIVISDKFATFAFTCKPCPGRGYSDYQ